MPYIYYYIMYILKKEKVAHNAHYLIRFKKAWIHSTGFLMVFVTVWNDFYSSLKKSLTLSLVHVRGSKLIKQFKKSWIEFNFSLNSCDSIRNIFQSANGLFMKCSCHKTLVQEEYKMEKSSFLPWVLIFFMILFLYWRQWCQRLQ